jgi:hypothetical protein
MFVTPWLAQTMQEQGLHVDAKLLIGYHLFPDEAMPAFQDCKVLKQGESFKVPYETDK